MTNKPHQDTQLAKYVEHRILELRSRKTQVEIAAMAGFVNPNMITMIKQGNRNMALEHASVDANSQT